MKRSRRKASVSRTLQKPRDNIGRVRVMATLKTYDKAEDFCVHLAFHTTDELSFNATLQRLDTLMERHFDEAQRREYSSAEQKEIIYRIQKPLFMAKDELNKFFGNLQVVFTVASSYSPHFTHYTQVESE